VGRLKLINDIINQLGTPAFNSNTFANRPAAGYVGRIFISTDTFKIQRDNGTGWDDIGGGLSGSGATGQVTFFTGASSISGDNAFFWDNINKRLGLGTTTPGGRVDIHAATNNLILNATTSQQIVQNFAVSGTNRFQFYSDNINAVGGQTGFPKLSLQNSGVGVTFIQTTNQDNNSIFTGNLNDFNNLRLSGADTSYNWGTPGSWYRFMIAPVVATPLFAISVPATNGGGNAGFVFDSQEIIPDHTFYLRCLGNRTFGSSKLQIITNNLGTQSSVLTLDKNLIAFFSSRVNVNNSVDNANFELNVNGNTYTGGLSPTILTVAVNTNMARTATGYYCTATLTLTLPVANGLNNWYIVIAGSGATVTVQRNGADDILNTANVSVTNVVLPANGRALFYVGGGTRTFQIF
jgi:hypothetical protein